jgi:hypothetical protein
MPILGTGMASSNFFAELTRIFTCPAKFVRRTATSWEIAGSAQPLQPIIVECFGIRGSSFASKGLLGFRPSGYEISELKRRNVYKVAVAYAVASWLLIQAALICQPTPDKGPDAFTCR